jgi:hypothetical protein
MRRPIALAILLAAFLFALIACAPGSAWRASYTLGVVLKDQGETIYAEGWEKPALERLAECDVPANETKAKFDACMGAYGADRADKVATAAAIFDAAMKAHAAALLAVDPVEAKPGDLMAAGIRACSAARAMVDAVDPAKLKGFDLATLSVCQ